MDDLDIQTAQLIIQLARDDIYQLDDNASSSKNQDGDLLSDLEFALAEQEREFMQYWAEYGDTQINQDAGRRAGCGGNVGNSGGANQTANAIAGPSRVPAAIRAESPRLCSATPIDLIDLIDDDDNDDIYVNPYNPAPSNSGSSLCNDHNRVRSPQPLATPISLIPVDNDHRFELALAGSDHNHNSNDVNRRSNNPFISADDRDDSVSTLVTLFSGWTAPDTQPNTNGSIRVTTATSIAGSALPDDEVVETPNPNSLTLEQLLSQVFALTNGPGSQATSSSTTVNHVPRFSGSQVPQAGPSNSVPQGANAVSTLIRPVSPDDPGDYAAEIIAGYQAARPIEVDISQPRATDSRQVVYSGVDDEELSDDESIYIPAEPNVECHFCKDRCPISTTINTSCNHRLCRGCISRQVEICIKDETLYPPQCCRQKLQTSELRMLDHGLRQQFQAKAREYETPIPVRVYCHRCGEFLDPDSSTISTGSSSSAMSIHTSRYCDVCFVRTCVSCKQASHPTRECQETQDERALKSLAKQKGWQRCPRCNAVVELSAGCYHVVCRCSAQFCYLCAMRWKECSCPAFDEERLLAMAAA